MKLVIVLFVAILSIEVAYAQGEYLERGSNGYKLGVAFVSHENIHGLAAAGAFSMAGTFDLGVSYAYLSEDGNSSTAITPFASVHIIKQSVKIPFSISGHIQFETQSFTSNNNQITSLGFLTYGGSITRSIDLSEKFILQPFITYSITNQISTSTGKSISSTAISLAFISNFTKYKGIIHPSVSFSEKETIYSIGIEFVGLLMGKS